MLESFHNEMDCGDENRKPGKYKRQKEPRLSSPNTLLRVPAHSVSDILRNSWKLVE